MCEVWVVNNIWVFVSYIQLKLYGYLHNFINTLTIPFFIDKLQRINNDISDIIYSSKNEAELTETKKKLVQKKTLADRINVMGLADYLIMGNGDVQNNINQEMSVKEDLFEAIIGAVALDSDWNMEVLQDVIEIMLKKTSRLSDA